MNYKVLILLLSLLFLVVLIYKEITTLKSGMLQNVDDLLEKVKDSNDKMIIRLQNNLIKCVKQIRDVSSDNLQQLERITKLNHQPVTKANHFTETDGSEIQDFNYLSEARDRKQVFEERVPTPKKDNNYYMSEGTDDDSEDTEIQSDKYNTSGGEIDKVESKQSVQYIKDNSPENKSCKDGICYLEQEPLVKVGVTVDTLTTDIPVYISNSIEPGLINTGITVDFPVYGQEIDKEEEEEEEENNSNDDEDIQKEVQDSTKTETIMIDAESDDDIDEESTKEDIGYIEDNDNDILMAIDDNDNSNQVSPTVIKINKDTEDYNEIELDIVTMLSSNNLPQNVLQSISKSVLEHANNKISKEEEEEENKDIDSEEIDISESVFHLINNPNIDNNNGNDGIRIEEINSEETSEESVSSESFDVKTTEKESIQEDTQEDTQEYTPEDSPEDSPVQVTVKKINSKSESKSIKLKKLAELNSERAYNIIQLRAITKSLKLTMSEMIEGKRVYYKKKDLYKNIKNHLSEKSK